MFVWVCETCELFIWRGSFQCSHGWCHESFHSWTHWLIAAHVESDSLWQLKTSRSITALYYLMMIKAEIQWEEFNQELCFPLFIVGKRCVGAMKSRLVSVGIIFKDTHTHILTHLPDSPWRGVATLEQLHKTSGISCFSGSSSTVDYTICYQRCVILQ